MKAKKTVCIYWLILIVVFGGIIGIRSTEIKVEAAERTVRFWDNSGNYLQKSGGNWYLKDSKKRKTYRITLFVNSKDRVFKNRILYV